MNKPDRLDYLKYDSDTLSLLEDVINSLNNVIEAVNYLLEKNDQQEEQTGN